MTGTLLTLNDSYREQMGSDFDKISFLPNDFLYILVGRRCFLKIFLASDGVDDSFFIQLMNLLCKIQALDCLCSAHDSSCTMRAAHEA